MTSPASDSHTRKLSRKFWVCVFLLIVALVAFCYFLFNSSSHLSDKDFASIEKKMDNMYVNVGIIEVDRAKSCYYYRDSMGKSLKCEVQMAGYIPIKDSRDLPAVIEKFEKQLKFISNADEIWRTPYGPGAPIRSGSFGVKDSKLTMGCQVDIKMEEGKVLLGRGLPEKDLNGKVALVLGCGGSSREPYFEMR